MSVPFIRATDIKDGEIQRSGLLYVDREQPPKMEKCLLRGGEVIIVRSGVNTGDCAPVPAELAGAYAAYDLILRFHDGDGAVRPEFIAAFLDTVTGRSQLNVLKGRSAQPHVNAEEVRSLLVARPSDDVQKRLLAALDAARAMRREKLMQAEMLLAGIDGFVLDVLGLTLPPDDRAAYAVRASDLSSHRLDAHFYTPRLRKLEAAIRHLPYQMVGLGTLLLEPPQNGLDARQFADIGRRYLRVQNVRPFELLLDDVKHVVVETDKDIALAAGDILLTRKGTYGVAAAVPATATDCLISSEIMLLRRRRGGGVSADFLVAWINCSACQALFYRHKSGGIMGHLTQNVVETIPVPVPDDKVQAEIAAKVSHCRDEARRLRDEAAVVWDNAKRRFEEELLGPDPSTEKPRPGSTKGGRNP